MQVDNHCLEYVSLLEYTPKYYVNLIFNSNANQCSVMLINISQWAIESGYRNYFMDRISHESRLSAPDFTLTINISYIGLGFFSKLSPSVVFNSSNFTTGFKFSKPKSTAASVITQVAIK